MRVLLTKLRRDMGRQRAQFFAVIMTIFLGVLLFCATYGAYQNLKGSYAATFDRLRFADLWVSGGDLNSFVATARQDPAVEAVEVRQSGEVAIRVEGDHLLRGQALSLPDTQEPAINRVLLDSGQKLVGPGTEVLAEKHFAEHFRLRPGDTIETLVGGTWRPVTVRGIAVSAEYLWPARSRQDILTPPDDFGVLFVTAPLASQLDLRPQALVRLGKGASDRDLTRLKALATAAGAIDVFGRDEQPSNAALQDDVSGFGELSWMFPLLFLTASSVTTYILLNRIVQSQRANIGMFLANGMPVRIVLIHYLGYGLFPAVVAGGLGAVTGILLGGALTHLYTSSLSIPLTITHVDPVGPFTGVGVAMFAGVLASALPAWSASRLAPALAMRGATSLTLGQPSLLERLTSVGRFLPLRGWLVLRNIGRARMRSLSIIVGVSLALTLIIVSWGMMDSMRFVVHRQFEQINREDARAYFAHAVTQQDINGLQAAGVQHAEPLADLEVSLKNGSNTYATELLAFQQDTRIHSFLLEDGSATRLPASGALLGKALRKRLLVKVGDTIQVVLSGEGVTIPVVVAGFVDEPLGTNIYVSIEELRRSASTAGVDSGALVMAAAIEFGPATDPFAIRAAVRQLPGIRALSDSRALQNTFDSLLKFFYVIVGIMLAFGAAMAFALMFNSISVTIAERTSELATWLAFGMSYRTVVLLLTAENLLVTIAGIAPGLTIAWFAGREFMASFNTDLFSFGWHPKSATLAFSALAIVGTVIAAQGPGLWAIRRLDLGAAIRDRSS